MAIKRIKPSAVTSKAEALKIIDDIARLEIARQAKESEMLEEIQGIQDTLGKDVENIQAQIVLMMDRVDSYIVEHIGELAKPGQREGETALALFGVRLGNPTVTKPRGRTWEELCEMLRDTMSEFVREKISVDKEAILKAWREGDPRWEMLHKELSLDITQNECAWVAPKAEEAL